jgi:hypothetical protein
MNAVDPLAGQMGERREVLFRTEPVHLETSHLACRGRASRGRFPADDPLHRGIMAQPLGFVDILISGDAHKHRLPQHADQGER